MSPNVDKAGVNYWDQIWDGSKLPRAIDPRDSSISNHVPRQFHAYFEKLFASMDTTKMNLLEIGCARSIWLPYFAKEYQFDVWGLDYSDIGCQQARQILAQEGVTGNIILGDAFAPPADMLGQFDIVISFGVVEHFADTAATLAAFAKFLKPTGILLTIIPNMTGIIGQLQKRLNRPVFDIHIPLDAEQLAEAHQQANLTVINTRYMTFLNLWVLSFQGIPPQSVKYRLARVSRALLGRLMLLPEWFGLVSVTRATASYVFCCAQKS